YFFASDLFLFFLFFFFFYCSVVHRDLHSFPTRRSSDLLLAWLGISWLGSSGGGQPASGARSAKPSAQAAYQSANHGSPAASGTIDRKSTRLNSSHVSISYAVFCLKKKKKKKQTKKSHKP